MADAGMTPEERLLKIIEGPVVPITKRASAKIKNSLDLNSLIEKIKKFHFDKDAFKNLDLGKVNKVLICICAIFTVLWLFDFVREGFAFRARFNKNKAEAALLTYNEETMPALDEPINSLVNGSAKRNIFTLTAQQNQAEAAGPTIGQEAQDNSALGGVKLVGIIWSDNPQAMLEDTKESKTFLVSTGDTVGDMKVKQILANKVIIGKEGKEWELR